MLLDLYDAVSLSLEPDGSILRARDNVHRLCSLFSCRKPLSAIDMRNTLFVSMTPKIAFSILALSIFAAARGAQAQQNPPAAAPALPPPNDTALFLAGMPVPENSPLAPLTRDPAWQEHSAFFENAFAKLNLRQLQKLALWETTYLPEAKQSIPVAFY